MRGSRPITVKDSRRGVAAPHGPSHRERNLLTESFAHMRQRGPGLFASIEAGRSPDAENIVRALTRRVKSDMAPAAAARWYAAGAPDDRLRGEGSKKAGEVRRPHCRRHAKSEAPMTKKRRGAHPDASLLADSAAHAALSREVRPLLEALDDIAERRGQDKNEPMLVEVEPGRFVEIRLPDRWRKLGGASAGNIEHARRLVDLAEAAFEAARATKQ